jgi:DNA-directed RNA polymerases I, II, and III subunit RPABC2
MNLKDDEIVDDVSESSDDFESDNEKNDNDDLEEDKVEVDDSDSDIETVGDEDDDNDDANEDIDEDDIILSSPLNKQPQTKDDSDDYDSDEDSDDEFSDDNCLQKFNNTVRTNLISEFHPELMEQNESEIELLSTVVRNSEGVIIDDLHRSIPFITKYERARVIGERTRQINSGAIPFIDVKSDIIDGYIIAINEFNKKKIPFIIKRPMPSGKCEYWKLSDLEIL